MRLQAWNRVRKDCASIVLANMYRRFKSRRELGRLSWKIQARRQKQVSEQHETHALRLQCWWRVYLASRLYMYSVRHHIEIIPDLSKRRLHYPDSSPDSVMATHGVRYKEIIYVGIIAITTLASALGHHQGVVLHFCITLKTMSLLLKMENNTSLNGAYRQSGRIFECGQNHLGTGDALLACKALLC